MPLCLCASHPASDDDGRACALPTQDLLRLLTLWFRYGGDVRVDTALTEGFERVDVDTWLLVIPQIIARISSPNVRVRKAVQTLLLRVGRSHPQASATDVCKGS
eukprot:4093898-Pleurochrysis_carterae.AAC.2